MEIFGYKFFEKQTMSSGQKMNISASDNFYNEGYDRGYYSHWDGDKFIGGFGDTQLFHLDYWTLRS